jgi:hypothetical protein
MTNFTTKCRKNYNDFTKDELVKEANELRVYLERFVENCSYHDEQGQLVRMVLNSNLSTIKRTKEN